MGLDELALCVTSGILPPAWRADNTALPIRWEDLRFLNGNFDFRSRREIESDYSWKQIIPYVLSFAENGLLLIYQRCGTESRLHGLWSAGIGGHVNQADASSSFFEETLIAGLKRECKEELGVTCQDFSLLGLINEEQTAVGHAHLGIVFMAKVPDSIPASSELSEWRFVSLQQVNNFRFELWSLLGFFDGF